MGTITNLEHKSTWENIPIVTSLQPTSKGSHIHISSQCQWSDLHPIVVNVQWTLFPSLDKADTLRQVLMTNLWSLYCGTVSASVCNELTFTV